MVNPLESTYIVLKPSNINLIITAVGTTSNESTATIKVKRLSLACFENMANALKNLNKKAITSKPKAILAIARARDALVNAITKEKMNNINPTILLLRKTINT